MNLKKDIILRIKKEVQNISTALKHKKATEKQVSYILNRVLIPRIEYRIQYCHIPANTCNKLTIELRRMLRNKLGICNTLSNSTIHHKSILNFKSIWEIQTELHISNLINRLNDKGPIGQATLIRLKQVQIENWEPTNIFVEEIPKFFNCKENFSANALKMASNFSISFENNQIKEIFQWHGGNFMIKKGLNGNILYQKSVSSMKKKKVMFI